MIAQLTNHLWQSTFFALAAALLTLAFRKNRAAPRHSVWLIASLKFLIPFSALLALARQLQWTAGAQRVAAHAPLPEVLLTIGQFSEPFPSHVPAAPHVSRPNTNWWLLANLDPGKGTGKFLVFDHVERPFDN